MAVCAPQGALAGDMGDTEPPGPGDTEVPEDVQETPVAVGPGLDTQDVEHGGSLRRLPSSPNPKAGESPPGLRAPLRWHGWDEEWLSVASARMFWFKPWG